MKSNRNFPYPVYSLLIKTDKKIEGYLAASLIRLNFINPFSLFFTLLGVTDKNSQ